jgi:O-antigen/teichoic acid export membrane protein
MPATRLSEALTILPFAMLSLWLMVIGGIFQAGIDGYQRIDLSSVIAIIGALTNLVLCILWVPIYGLMGLAYARVSQTFLQLLLNWIILKRLFPLLPLFPYRWDKKIFVEMLGYGVNFQLITFSVMLCDPVTKGLLTKFGGLSLTGLYEMASRMVIQLRGLIVAANGVLVPTIASLYEKRKQDVLVLYKNTYRLLLYISIPYFSFIIALTPIISRIWVGHYEKNFVFFSILLSIGWFLNTLIGPAYFSNLGVGEIKWNTIGHIIQVGLNVVLGYWWGHVLGGTWVVIAWVVSLVAASLFILVAYHSRHEIPIADLFPKDYIGIGIAGLTGIGLAFIMNTLFSDKLSSLFISAVLSLLIIAPPLWWHPLRPKLVYTMMSVIKGQ